MEVDASNRSIMLFKSVDQCAHSVIPELDRRRVQGDEDPWPAGVSLGAPKGSVEWDAHLLGWKASPFAREDLDSN